MAFSLAASTSFTPVLRCKPCELSCIQPAIQCANLGASNALSSGKKKAPCALWFQREHVELKINSASVRNLPQHCFINHFIRNEQMQNQKYEKLGFKMESVKSRVSSPFWSTCVYIIVCISVISVINNWCSLLLIRIVSTHSYSFKWFH